MADRLSNDQISEYKEAFNMFCFDARTSNNATELGVVMRSLGENPTDAELDAMVAECGHECEGFIEFHEFLTLMARRLEGSARWRRSRYPTK
jgi:calmodulin